MRIVSWNCKNGFTADKAKAINIFSADILVIQECTQTDYDQEKSNCASHDFYCDGEDSNLGVAIFSKKLAISSDTNFDKRNRYVIPYKITGAKEPFVLYAVWTKKPSDNNSNYHTPVYNVLSGLSSPPIEKTIFIGDFNTGSIHGASNAHWYDELNFECAKKGFYNCANGQEWVSTFFRGNTSWLDDHCFATISLKTFSFGIGNREYWQEHSDHCPIIVDFDL